MKRNREGNCAYLRSRPKVCDQNGLHSAQLVIARVGVS